ncbi:hypothetical protein [Nocardioides conyzicola]|uniref:hypothetical protein n=1 Tax=Nocardioides conyzicola TaxID=1651781 RepID=UPI0031E94588
MAAVALAAAAALTFAASWQRWSGACPRGAFDTDACLPLQSHEYDFQVPSDPWTPVGQAAQLYGGALLALAVAALLLPMVLARPRQGWWRVFAVLVAVVPAASLALLGAVTLRSGQTGHVVSAAGAGLAFLVWCLLWPACLTALAAAAPGSRPSRAVPVAVLVGLSTPIPALLVVGPLLSGYTSYDTAPWSDAAAAPLLLAAAVAVLFAVPAQSSRPWSYASSATPRESLEAGSSSG